MLELYRHLGPDTDVPAGDIGVGAREVGFMAGMMKKLSNQAGCVFTGKGVAYGGSLMRPEATGFGTVYFVEQMLHHAGRPTNGARVLVSGSGNVAQFAAVKANELGGKVLTFSDSDGTLYARDGFDPEAIEQVAQLKNERRGRLSRAGRRPALRIPAGPAPVAHPGRDRPALRHPERTGRRGRAHAGQERRDLRGRGREHALDAGRGGRVPRSGHAVRTGQGLQRRRRGDLGPGDVAELAAPVLGTTPRWTSACTRS